MSEPQLFDDVKEVHAHVLRLLTVGAIASTAPIDFTGAPVKPLAEILGYSKTTQLHQAWLIDTLQGVDFSHLRTGYAQFYEIDPRYDFVYNLEGRNHVYYLSQYAQRHPHPISPVNDGAGAAFLRNDNNNSGFWIFSYYFIVGRTTSDLRIAASDLYPEKNLLLNFWFTPSPLPADYFSVNFPGGSESLRRNIHKAPETLIDGFRHLNASFDAKALADWYETFPGDTYITTTEPGFLRARGNFTLSIVQLGLTSIGGQPYWIYSGSERIAKNLAE